MLDRALSSAVEAIEASLGVLSAELLEAHTPSDLYGRVLRRVVNALPLVRAGTIMVRDASGRYRFVAAVGHRLDVLSTIEFAPPEILFDARSRSTLFENVLSSSKDVLDPDRYARLVAGTDTTNISCTLAVPVMVGGIPRAVLYLDSAHPAEEVRLLRPLAELCGTQVALVLQRFEVDAAVRAARQELALLEAVREAVTSSREQGELFERVTRAVYDLMHADHVSVSLLDGEAVVPTFTAGRPIAERRFHVSSGVVGRVARTGVPALLRDVTLDPDYVPAVAGVISEVCVPLTDGERVAAVLNLESVSRRFDEEDLRQLTALVSWLGRALERERLHAATERQRRALDLLHQVRGALSQELDEDRAVRIAVESLARLLGYSYVGVSLRTDGELKLRHAVGEASAAHEPPARLAVLSRVLATGRSVWLEDVTDREDGVTSQVCVPIALEDDVIGALNVECTSDRRLGEDDAQLVAAVGGFVASTLERARLHAKVRDREALYRLLAEHTSDLVCLHEADGTFVYVSPSVTPLLGFSPEELVGRRADVLLGADAPWSGAVDATLPSRWAVRSKSGRTVWFETKISRVGDGRDARVLSASRDVTARRAVEARLEWAATHDALTGLANRTVLFEKLDDAIRGARRTGRADHAVLYLDMDRFKVVNDSLGHTVGDELLVAFARRLEATMNEAAVVARLGGDEFAVLLRGVSGKAAALDAASRLRAGLDEPFTVAGHRLRVAVSIGIAIGRAEDEDAVSVLRDADLGMYHAKRTRRGVSIFSPDLHTRALRQLRLEVDLPRAVEAGQLEVDFQPIVELRGGLPKGYEALVRWRHPLLGRVPPSEFVAIAEELGVIAQLGAWVLSEACAALARTFAPGTYVQVNVSPRQFRDGALVSVVAHAIETYGVAPNRLVLEVTEQALVEDLEHAGPTLAALRALGVHVHIDDFGTGSSSLAFLHRFPVDGLKIDRAFVAALGADDVSEDIVRTILLLARALRLEVVAEGIETVAQRDHLLRLGCRLGQGFVFCPPVPAEEAARWAVVASP